MSCSKDESDLFGIAGQDRLTRIYHKMAELVKIDLALQQ